MNKKMCIKFRGMFGQMVRNKRGLTPLALAGIVLIIIIAGIFFLLTWMLLANLETIGKGLLYISGALLMMVAVAILAKRFLFPSKGVR